MHEEDVRADLRLFYVALRGEIPLELKDHHSNYSMVYKDFENGLYQNCFDYLTEKSYSKLVLVPIIEKSFIFCPDGQRDGHS